MQIKFRIKLKKFFDALITQIMQHDKISLFVHENPDFDTLGSAYGLKTILQANFPNKQYHVLGIKNAVLKDDKIRFFPVDDDLEVNAQEFAKNSVGIFLDAPILSRFLARDCFETCDVTFKIDHHVIIDAPFTNYEYLEVEQAATCQLVIKLAYLANLKIPANAATYLYAGLITDTNRFYFDMVSAETYYFAQILYELGADRQKVHNFLYNKTKNQLQYESYLMQFVQYHNGVVSLYVPDKSYEKYNIQWSQQFAYLITNIEDYPVALYARFDDEKNAIRVSLRSRNMPIIDLAKKHRGGGHILASGCVVKDQEEFQELIQETVQAYEQYKKQNPSVC